MCLYDERDYLPNPAYYIFTACGRLVKRHPRTYLKRKNFLDTAQRGGNLCADCVESDDYIATLVAMMRAG